MMKPDYCPVGGEPCQSLCDEPCTWVGREKAVPTVKHDAQPVREPATITECEACFTPDVCQLRGTCDYYSAERIRVAASPAPDRALQFALALVDIMDGMEDHDIQAHTGLPDAECEAIAGARKDARAFIANAEGTK
jgi:hypothetical protein